MEGSKRRQGQKNLIPIGGTPHSWNFGLAVSYLEGEPEEPALFEDTKAPEIQLWMIGGFLYRKFLEEPS